MTAPVKTGTHFVEIMKLKITKIKELQTALLKLDGVERVVKIDDKDKIVKEPFKFSGKVRWNIAKNVGVLNRKLEGFDKVRGDLITQISGGTNIIKPEETEKMKEFQAQMADILQNEEEVDGLLKLKESDLDLDSNAIPTEAIIGLDLLIE